MQDIHLVYRTGLLSTDSDGSQPYVDKRKKNVWFYGLNRKKFKKIKYKLNIKF